MSDLVTDPVVAQALRDLPVPEHGPGFWEELEQRLPAADAPRGVEPADRALADLRIATGELPALQLLGPEPAGARRRRAPFLVAAAAVAVLALAAGVVVRSTRDGGTGVPVEQAAATTTAAAALPSAVAAPATPVPEPVPVLAAGAETATDAVLFWISALGSGDPVAAATLLGPRTQRYLRSIGADPVGFMVESEEGYGAWAASRDIAMTEVVIPRAGSVVVVSGEWTGEGAAEVRDDAFPVVQGADGGWFVEPVAFSPTTGGRPSIVTPTPTPDGWSGEQPDVVLEATAEDPDVTFWFSLDGAPAVVGPGGVWDPPGALRSGTHLLVVAVVGDDIFGALAGTFVVES